MSLVYNMFVDSLEWTNDNNEDDLKYKKLSKKNKLYYA